MKEIISWLRKVEHLARGVYSQAAAVYAGDETFSNFLNHLAEEEAWHFHVMGNAADFLDFEPNFQPAITIDAPTSKRVIRYFSQIEDGLKNNTLSKDELLERIVEAELSEWNDIFYYVVNSLKEKSDEFKYPAARIQSHVKGIEHYLETFENKPDIHKKIKSLPAVWVEKILIAEDNDMIADLIRSLLNREGHVDVVSNGRDALTMMQKNYYKLIISDINMPVLDGLSLYKEAMQTYPHISSRFLFISGNLTAERIRFFEENEIQYLSKPMGIKELRDIASQIILKN